MKYAKLRKALWSNLVKVLSIIFMNSCIAFLDTVFEETRYFILFSMIERN